MFMLPVKFLAELYPMAPMLIQINIFFLLISISSRAVWITNLNKCILETLFFTSFFISIGQQRFAVIGDLSRAGSY